MKVTIRIFSIRLVREFLESLYCSDYFNFDACFDEMIRKVEINPSTNCVEMKYKDKIQDFHFAVEEITVSEDQLENGFQFFRLVE